MGNEQRTTARPGASTPDRSEGRAKGDGAPDRDDEPLVPPNKQRSAEQLSYAAVFEATHDAIYTRTLQDVITTWNPGAERLYGYSPQEAIGHSCLMLIPPDCRQELEEKREQVRRGESVAAFETRRLRKTGEMIHVSIALSPVTDEAGHVTGMTCIARDVTEHRKLERMLASRASQQAAVAALGQKALAEEPLQDLLEEAVRALVANLATEYVKVLELDSSGEALRLRAGVGWREGLVGHATVSAGRDSQAGFTLLVGEPVIVTDLRAETRFRAPPLLLEQGVLSGMSCVIHGPDKPYGVLGTHTARRREFSDDDVNFLRSVANVLAAAVERRRAEEALRQAHEFSENLVETARTIVLVLDTAGRIVRFNAYLEELTGWRLAEVRGKDWFKTFLPARDREQTRALFGGAIDGERTRGNVNSIVTKAGRERVIEWFDAVLTSARGERIGLLCTGQDITERKAAEEALWAAEKQLRTITDAVPALIGYVDSDGVYRLNNRSYETWFGYRREEMTGQPISRVLGPAAWEKVRPRLERALAGEEVQYEDRLPYAGGGSRWVQVAYTPDRDAEGRVRGVVILVTDIGAIKAAEEVIRDNAARLSAVVSTAVDAIITIDERGIIDSVNPATERLFGYAADELLGRNVRMLMPKPYRAEHDGYLSSYVRTGQKKIIGTGREVVGLRKDGTTFPLDLSVSEFEVGGRRMFTGILHDSSQRRRLEREVLQAAAVEQRRIGQDLHDGVCQLLVGTAFAVEVLTQKLSARAAPEAAAMAKLARNIDQAIAQARQLARGLHPIDLNEGGLGYALEGLAAEVGDLFKISCLFIGHSPPCRVDDLEVATHLYRIAQEAASNAFRHGKCRTIVIELAESDAQVCLTVKDDGMGLKRAAGKQGRGIGLQTMSYRANIMGGSLSVQPGNPSGTVVACVVPRQSIRSGTGTLAR